MYYGLNTVIFIIKISLADLNLNVLNIHWHKKVGRQYLLEIRK